MKISILWCLNLPPRLARDSTLGWFHKGKTISPPIVRPRSPQWSASLPVSHRCIHCFDRYNTQSQWKQAHRGGRIHQANSRSHFSLTLPSYLLIHLWSYRPQNALCLTAILNLARLCSSYGEFQGLSSTTLSACVPNTKLHRTGRPGSSWLQQHSTVYIYGHDQEFVLSWISYHIMNLTIVSHCIVANIHCMLYLNLDHFRTIYNIYSRPFLVLVIGRNTGLTSLCPGPLSEHRRLKPGSWGRGSGPADNVHALNPLAIQSNDEAKTARLLCSCFWFCILKRVATRFGVY